VPVGYRSGGGRTIPELGKKKLFARDSRVPCGCVD
jgi:hypothetical protein